MTSACSMGANQYINPLGVMYVVHGL